MDERYVREALFWESDPEGGKDVRCLLCAHRCRIKPGNRGICGVRENREGRLVSLIFGAVSSAAVDPVEKKPLYHFLPGSRALSFGTVGCNFHCQHCQNWEIAASRPESFPLRYVSPGEVVDRAVDLGVESVAWTYNEPTIWYEFTLETSRMLKKRGIRTIYVTNGYISEEALDEHAPYLDAMNIDVKAFAGDFYRKIVGGRLEPVLATVERAVSLGIYVELTYLLIPGLNDRREEIREFSRWAVSISPDIPVHISRFFPNYKMTHVPPTPMKTLSEAYDIMREEGLLYVYPGNVPHDSRENTYCPQCGSMVIERVGYHTTDKTDAGRCPSCGFSLPGVWG
ncbi:MAG: AmmeMemoRadiSam system radical SAM enzyme [Thermoplasmata archaeon]|nr:AmmeMemoRadiSam system radical SAM enzyme [Thermoplasmata archaeon]